MTDKIKIATRGSPLAIAQANLARDRLIAVAPHMAGVGLIEIVPIRTTGDKMRASPLAMIGGKGLFTKEIEEALLENRADIAVHSMKDLPTVLPDGLKIQALLPREDPRDALIAHDTAVNKLEDLPIGASVGTASLRRRALLLNRRPDIQVKNLRGNINTRLKKIEAGTFDATFLAVAGLKRLGLSDKITRILDAEEMLPAVCQGALGLECRQNDEQICELLTRVNHPETYRCVEAERAFLKVLDGSCQTPIGGLAVLNGSKFSFRGLVIRPDGSEKNFIKRDGCAEDSLKIAISVGTELKERAGSKFFSENH